MIQRIWFHNRSFFLAENEKISNFAQFINIKRYVIYNG